MPPGSAPPADGSSPPRFRSSLHADTFARAEAAMLRSRTLVAITEATIARARERRRHVRAGGGDARPSVAAPAALLRAPEDASLVVPPSMRRALDYMAANVLVAVSADDVASHARVTPRALQLAFRRHLATTPQSHLRRLRLEAARSELEAAGGRPPSVGELATRWRFSSPSRFSRYYRETYGELPSETIHRLRAGGALVPDDGDAPPA